ncbi:hypothetical protein [Microbacterium sp. SLBN-111]|uniref:hypothetical protein n=1 Tax=Microbacterium sp. SLBN-111 TaxID=3377733 RepID=UPI003C7563DA
MNPLVALTGPIFLAMGIVAYSGVWKGWIRVRRGYGSTMGFAWFWLGLAFTIAALAMAIDDISLPAAMTLLIVAVVPFLVALLGFFWLPRFLLPSWFRVLRGDPDAVTKAQR